MTSLVCNLGACEVVLVEPEDRVDVLEQAGSSLVRYGRVRDRQILDTYMETAKARGLYLRDLPIAVVRATSEDEVKGFRSFMGGVNNYVEVDTPAGRVSVKPVILQFGGLDGSKDATEDHPTEYLLLPFCMSESESEPGLIVSAEDFQRWLRQ